MLCNETIRNRNYTNPIWRWWTIKNEMCIIQLQGCEATQFQRFNACFPDRATRLNCRRVCPTWKCVGNRTLWPFTGSRNGITIISACAQDSDKISTAIPIFRDWGTTTRLLKKLPERGMILSEWRVNGQSKTVVPTGSRLEIASRSLWSMVLYSRVVPP